MVLDKKNELSAQKQLITTKQLVTKITNSSEISALNTKNSFVSSAQYFKPNIQSINSLAKTDELLSFNLPISNQEVVNLQLVEAKPFTDNYTVVLASKENVPLKYNKGKYYWGIVNNDVTSLASIVIQNGEISGNFTYKENTYNVGKIANSPNHIVYNENDIIVENTFKCLSDNAKQKTSNKVENLNVSAMNSNNCVRMYVEVNNALYRAFGSNPTAVTNYVNGLFAQITIMYANENINLKLNKLKIWDTPDPYVYNGQFYLDSFTSILGTSFDGDLAHLLIPFAGYGVAWLNVLCTSNRHGETSVQRNFQAYPIYTWDLNAVTHEIGHNLGSPHTHACSWNGPNGFGGSTAIDRCGPNVGYSEGNCFSGAPTPPKGTVMSYCHIAAPGTNPGVDPTLGFGTQPGDRIRSRVYNNSCLQPCAPPPATLDAGVTTITEPTPFPCTNTVQPIIVLKNFGSTTLTKVTIQYKIDNNATQTFVWTGSLATTLSVTVNLPNVTYSVGNHIFYANSTLPNDGVDANTANDGVNKSFEYILNYCECIAEVGNFPVSVLTRPSGTGSVSTTFTLPANSQDVSFSVSDMNAILSGERNVRFVEKVLVTYRNQNNILITQGTYNGDIRKGFNVSIPASVSPKVISVTITLSNGMSTFYSSILSISISPVNYCKYNIII